MLNVRCWNEMKMSLQAWCKDWICVRSLVSRATVLRPRRRRSVLQLVDGVGDLDGEPSSGPILIVTATVSRRPWKRSDGRRSDRSRHFRRRRGIGSRSIWSARPGLASVCGLTHGKGPFLHQLLPANCGDFTVDALPATTVADRHGKDRILHQLSPRLR